MLRACVSAFCDILQQTGGTICYGHGFLHLVVSYSRQEVRFVTGMGLCILRYLAADGRYDLLRAWGSASSGILQQTGRTMCYRDGFLHLVVSYSRQQVRSDMGRRFCIL